MGSCSVRRTTGFPATLNAPSGEPIEKVRHAFVDRQPIDRLGKAEEIAAISVDLAPTQIKSL
jgi:hypothetical protein